MPTVPQRSCRIAHLHSTLGVYGAERWTLALLKHLDQAEFKQIVISIGTKPGADSFNRMVTAEGFTAFHIPVSGKLNPRGILALRRLVVHERVNILHTHGFKADVLGFLASRRLPLSLVSTIHGWSADESMRIRAYEEIGRQFLKHFDRVYPLSPALLENLLQRNFDSQKLRMILNAVDLTPFDFKFNSRKIGDPFFIVFVGRLCRPKGIFELIHAFAEAKFEIPVELNIVGDGPDRSELEQLCRSLKLAGKVKFVGMAPSIAPFLKASNVLVLPSHSEGIPRVVMEAFAVGVPVIGSAIAGIKQLVKDEITGLLVPVRDPNALARALERMASHPRLGYEMAVTARQVVIDDYSAHRMANDFADEYRRLCYRV